MIPCYKSLKPLRCSLFSLMLPAVMLGAIALPSQVQIATAQANNSSGDPLYINSKIQEYNAKTQVATMRGDVEMSYPARGIKATAAQAQYLSQERRIILNGDVYILQNGGNSIRGETVTYLIDEGRFIAEPKAGRQVQSIYIVEESNAGGASKAPATPPLKRSN